MIGIYFSGTGNTKYCVEKFLFEYNQNLKSYSIEDDEVISEIEKHDQIIIGYPTQFSTIPKYLYDFIEENKNLWKNKKIYIIVTMALFSGDGAGILGRLLEKYNATITGGLHLKMPDSICDEKVLKRSLSKNKLIISKTNTKIIKAVGMFDGNPTNEGLSNLNRLVGFLGQRLYFQYKTKKYSDKLKINLKNCIGCGKCEKICPTKNIVLENKKAISLGKCTMCYRCINNCPKQAITLLGKKVIEQSTIDKYINEGK